MSNHPILCVNMSTARWSAWSDILIMSPDIHVILSVEKLRHKAEATMHLSGGNMFADAEQEDMYAAIDALVDKLDRQVKKTQGKND